MPWLVIEKLPLIKSAVPARLVMYAFLALAVIFALWLSDPRTGAVEKGIGFFAIVLMLMPNPAASFWATRAPVPEFFRDEPRVACSPATISCCHCRWPTRNVNDVAGR